MEGKGEESVGWINQYAERRLTEACFLHSTARELTIATVYNMIGLLDFRFSVFVAFRI